MEKDTPRLSPFGYRWNFQENLDKHPSRQESEPSLISISNLTKIASSLLPPELNQTRHSARSYRVQLEHSEQASGLGTRKSSERPGE